jgi:hypothetical protein
MNENTASMNTTTVAHELVARDEQIVGVFFSAFAIQYFLHKDMLNNKLIAPNFLNIFADIETYATQRMFIKNLIGNKKYSKVIEDLQSVFLEYCANPTKNSQPYLLFLSRINKAFLIRQVFQHSDQVLEKYQFIQDFLGKEQVDLDKLNTKMWHFPVEQQILILARIYSTIHDEYEEKKKTIINSYKENVQRLIEEVNKNPARYQVIQVNNLKLFKKSLIDYDESTNGVEDKK